MSVLLLIVVTGVAAWAAIAAARAISSAHLNRALRADAPTQEDVAAVMSLAPADAPPARAA
jgi:hypothetical protein